MTATAYRLKPRTCPHCKTKHDAATSIAKDAAPQTGDFGICAKCFQPVVYTNSGLRKVRSGEMNAVQRRTVKTAQRAMRVMKISEELKKRDKPGAPN